MYRDKKGRVISSYSLTSASEETVLTVRPDKTVLAADGQSLCYLPIEFTDINGNLKPYIEQRVEIEVEGAAVLAGFGSALYKTDELFDKPYHDSYRGRALAVLRSGYVPGKAIVTVKTAGAESVKIELEVK